MINYIFIGLLAGIVAGFFGVGGGVIVVPLLIWMFQYDQHTAQGISLAVFTLPVGLFSAYVYHKHHSFSLQPIPFIALGILFGAFVGANIAQWISTKTLRIAFGVFMILVAMKLIFQKN